MTMLKGLRGRIGAVLRAALWTTCCSTFFAAAGAAPGAATTPATGAPATAASAPPAAVAGAPATVAGAAPGAAVPAKFDAAAFDAWFDRHFAAPHRAGDAFTAMALVVVQGDRVVAQRTLGLARHAPAAPIDARRTRFLIGSATKTFTGIAVAQLVERGRIASIDDPANRYLRRLQLPGDRGARVTVRDLLTHSAGYDARFRGTGTAAAVSVPLDGAAIAALAPALVREPGTLVSYSNYSTGLLATLVEDITGEPIERYLSREVWQPIGMAGTAFERGLAPSADLALAHRPVPGGTPVPQDFIAFHPYFWPVGAAALSLPDMAAYLRFHLAAARGQDQPALKAATHAQLRSRLRANHPALGGFGFQTMVFPWNGRELFGHGGTWPGYESMFFVSPRDDLAVFFSITGPARIGNMVAGGLLLKQLFGPWQPGPAGMQAGALQTAGSAAGAPARDDDAAGVYRPVLRAHRGLEAVLAHAPGGQPSLRVTLGAEGLRLAGEGPFRPVGPSLYASPDAVPSAANPFGSPVYGVVRDAQGQATHLADLFGLVPLQKIHPAADPALGASAMQVLQWLALAGLGALGWSWRGGRRVLAIGAALVPALSLWGLWLPLATYAGPGGIGGYVLTGGSGRFVAMAWIGNAAVAAAAVLAWVAWRRWSGREPARAWVRWHTTLMAAVAAGAAATLASMHAIGW